MEVQGKIKVLGETQTYGADFTKRVLVVETQEQYPQLISIDFIKDKCSILDKYKVGQNVKVGINLGGREWINPDGEAKYFNSIQGWRIDAVDETDVPAPSKPQLESVSNDVKDDLPF